MNLKEERRGDVVIVMLSGKLMGGDETKILHEKIRLLAESGAKKLVLDMAQVKWMNSSGLGALMSGMTTMKTHGGDLRLASVADKVENLLMITQLLKIFKTFPTLDEAIQSYSHA